MRQHKARYLGLVLMLALLSSAFTCNGYLKAAELSRDFALGVKAFQDSEIVFHQSGKISDQEHQVIQSQILRVAMAGQQMDVAITQSHNAKNATDKVNAALDATNNLISDGVLGVKNPESKAALQASVATLKSILGSILALGGH